MSDRSTKLNRWLEQLGYRDYRLSPASEDASFRSYLRLQMGDKSWIVMDARADKASCKSFIAIAQKLRDANLSAPEIFEQDLRQGFLILTDFGDSEYLSLLNPESEGSLHAEAFAALLRMQLRINPDDLPAYDAALLNQELDLFPEWFLGKLLGIELTDSQQDSWRFTKQALVTNALEQPQVFVHRDYHSRNLMKLAQSSPGILDFQGALKGPITYDLVSLLRDCYIDWPPARVDRLALDYYELLRVNELVDVDAAQFMRWFNLMGIQRHLKAIGIFSRLKIRDGKLGYQKDIPRTLEYVHHASSEEMSMRGLFSMIDQLGLKSRVRVLTSQ